MPLASTISHLRLPDRSSPRDMSYFSHTFSANLLDKDENILMVVCGDSNGESKEVPVEAIRGDSAFTCKPIKRQED